MPIFPPPAPVTANNGTALTVPFMLKNPRFFERRISELYLEEDFGGVIFTDGGGVDGGAAAYQVAEGNVYRAQSDVERVAPGAEFPKVKFGEEILKSIRVDKYGGEFDVPDETRLRNRVGLVERDTILLANMLILRDQALALSVLTAGVANHNRSGAGSGWATYSAMTATTAPLSNPITEDITNVTLKPTVEKTPYKYTVMIANPQEYALMVSVHGNAQAFTDYLRGLGITRLIVSGLQTAGKVKFVDPNLVGLRFYEGQNGVVTNVRREEGRETDVVKAKSTFAYAVTDPLAMWELTGLAA